MKRLKELREEKGLTQEELGKLVNLTKANISKYENGSLEPNLDTLNFFADYFHVSIDYLLNKTNIRTPIETIAAHHDGDEFTEEELEDIEAFKEFVRSKRNKKE